MPTMEELKTTSQMFHSSCSQAILSDSTKVGNVDNWTVGY